jgi:pyruvate ferredoxin oxidoreductase gamma subunit
MAKKPDTGPQGPTLPVTNELGYYEMRLESIGGMGANLAGHLLAEACILKMGFNGLGFASYGSEKKGTPVKSFLRLCACDQEVTDNSPVERPHLLAVFTEQLIGNVPITQGTRAGGAVVVNTARSPREVIGLLKLPACRVLCVDALKISMEEKVPLNTAMMGAICRGSGFISREAVLAVIEERIGKKYPQLLDANVRAFDRGSRDAVELDACGEEGHPEVPFVRPVAALGYENAPAGGVITNPGNTVLKDNSASRAGYVPVWHEGKCIHCGDCDLACPDLCMAFERATDDKGKPTSFMRGIDYRYCKGCLRCVSSCPVQALTTGVEKDVDVKSLRVELRRFL